MNSLAEIEKAAEALPLEQKRKLMLFLGASLREASGYDLRKLSPAERADDFRRWVASNQSGPGLPNSAIGPDVIYD